MNIDDRLRDATAAVNELVDGQLDVDADLQQVMQQLAAQPEDRQRHLAEKPRRTSTLGLLLRNPVHNLPLAQRIMAVGLRLLPAAHRQRYAAEWAADLDFLAERRTPQLGLAVRLMLQVPRLAVVLFWHQWRRPSPRSARRLQLVRPWLMGVATALMVAAGALLTVPTPPTWPRAGLVALASLLGGLITAWQGWARQQTSDDHDEPEEKKARE